MRKDSAILINELQKLASNAKTLMPADEGFVKNTFKQILESGDNYNMHEIEHWFANDDDKTEQKVLDRIMNIAHYQKSKFDAENKFKIISNDDGCSCGGH